MENSRIQELRKRYGTDGFDKDGKRIARTVGLGDIMPSMPKRAIEAQKPAPAPKPAPLTFEQHLDRFRETWWRSLVSERIKRNDKTFKVDYTDKQREVIVNLVRYFTNDPESPYPLHKGIVLYGAVGCGKSQLMQCFEAFAKGTPKEFRIINFESRLNDAKAKGDTTLLTECYNGQILFDDVGVSNNDKVVDYGNSLDMLHAVVYERNQRFEKANNLTHFVTNLDPSQFSKILTDPRDVSRVNGMCTPVLFTSNIDHRKK